MFAPFTGAGLLRKSPPDRYVINYRASYAEETTAMIDALITLAKLKPNRDCLFYPARYLWRCRVYWGDYGSQAVWIKR